MTFYSTAVDVIGATGVEPDDLSQADSASLTSLIEDWLLEIKDIIDADRKRDFLDEAGGDPLAVRKLVHNVAKRMASNMVALAVLRRDTSIVKMDDFSVQLVSDRVLTEDVRRDLALIPRGSTASLPIGMWRSRSQEEQDEDDG